jgi:Na+/alanine symporter
LALCNISTNSSILYTAISAETTGLYSCYWKGVALAVHLGGSAALFWMLITATDTIIIWNLSLLTVAFMVIPNLFGILTLHREMKSTIKEYWQGFREEYPDEKTPKN